MRSGNDSEMTIQAMLEGLVKHLGGVDEFTKQLALDYRSAQPGTIARQRVGSLIVSLAVAHAKVQDVSEDLSDVSTEDLEITIKHLLGAGQAPGAEPSAQ